MASSMKGFEHLEIQLEEIKSATNNFNEKNVIGTGGFGKVYKGELSHSHSKGKSMVALKRLDRRYGQGESEFHKEVRMLSRYRHENIVSLLGFSSGRDENEMILVYEYASRGSLDGHLKDVTLTWTQRIKVCLDAAKGLCYLHDPKDTFQRLIHCDIKSANILLDENFKAKVSDFGLSKIGPANQQNSMLITSALGTLGYCDPLFMETYSLTKESDVYSFGVVLLEVLFGKLCFEFSNGQLNILVPMWKQSYEQKQLSGIVFQGLMEQMNPDSLEIFADIAYKCLKRSREERPTMSLVVEKLQESLALQELHDIKLPKEYEEIVNAAVPPLNYRSLDELKVLLTEGFHINDGKTWFSISEKGEHYGMISIQDCLIQDDPSRDYSDQYSFEKNSRFEVGCYKTHLMEFKLHVRTPLFLSPDITYGLNLVFHYSEREKMKQQHVGVRYQLQGETKFSILRFADKREDKQLVAELYQFTSNKEDIHDLEILLEDCGLLGDFYIEGIEFQPLERMVLEAIVASSTDNYPQESIHHTLEPGDRVDHRASYWSSEGDFNPEASETLVYKLIANLCVITEIHIHPFQAYFQFGFPIYSAKAVRFRLGHLKPAYEFENDIKDEPSPALRFISENVVWTYTSPSFPMAQESRLQKFKLPEPALCIGGILQIELLGRVQKQEMDEKYYICVSHVQVVGRPLSPAFDVDIIDPSGKCTLKYYPDAEYCCSPIPSEGEASGSPSRFRSFTASIRGWEQMILNTLLGGGVVVGNDDSDDDIVGLA